MHPWNQRNAMGLLLEGFVTDSECSHRVQVDCYRGNLNITKMEWLGKLFDLPVL
jgi:hypothetical protein